MLGGESDRTTSEVTKLLAEMPPAVQAITGVDLSKVMQLKKIWKCGKIITTSPLSFIFQNIVAILVNFSLR